VTSRILVHDEISLVVTGHEDKQIRFFDLNAKGKPNLNKIGKAINTLAG
jgi:hypothetical protein